MILHEGHEHEESGHDHHGDAESSVTVWKGVVILTVLAVFFVIERLLNIFGEWRQRLQSTKQVNPSYFFICRHSLITLLSNRWTK